MDKRLMGIALLAWLCLNPGDSGRVFAVEERWSPEVSGEVLLEEMTPDEAKKICINRAKAAAIEKVAGVRILSETFVKDAQMLSDFINAASFAWVKNVKDVRWDFEDYRKRPDSPPVPMYRVHLKALVILDKEGDPGFTVKLGLNRLTYQDGDEMAITAHLARDGYITLFNILPDDRVTVLLPNKKQPENNVRKGQVINFPDTGTTGNQRKLKVYRSEKKKVSKEAILAVATKDNVDLVGTTFKEGSYSDYDGKTGFFRELLEKLITIPPRDRALAIQYYEIREK